MTTRILVTDDQVESAALIDISGGPDDVDPLITKIASAQPRSREDVDRTIT